MKNRRQKQIAPKKGKQVVEQMQQVQISTTSAKNPSGHTKISTNCTIHSTVALNPTSQKRSKNKKNGRGAVKQNSSDSRMNLSCSKQGRKVRKYELALREQVGSLQLGEQSCREYCVVEQNFVPIRNIKQHKLLQDMLARTAETSYDKNFFANEYKESRHKLRKKSMSSEVGEEYVLKEIQKYDKAISNIQREIEFQNTEVEARVQCCEIGLQYSQRKFENQQKEKEEEKIEPIVEKNQESLTDLFFKLEFGHLGDDNSFTHLSSHEKQHFTQLLQTVITKLKPVQKAKSKIKPISFDGFDSESPCQSEQTSPKNHVNDQRLQGMILMREYTQLNCIQDSFNYSENNQVNTSLISILNFVGYLFCQIEVGYAEEFVYMIRKMYGLPYREKYKRITRNIPLNGNRSFKVVQDSVFEEMVQENSKNEYNKYQIVHFKAVFDALNQHFEEYRPYYLGNGEQFPWAFKMFITMSEYSIDEDSLQIIFRQAKEKIVQWSTLLCGLHVTFDEKLKEGNPLELKNLEKQNKLVSSWIDEQNFTKDGIQLYSTQTLHETAEKIYAELLQEFSEEFNYIFN